MLLVLVALLGLASGCGPSHPEESAEERRSVVLITLDTARADGLSCLGGREGTTPNLDALAVRSSLFTEARSETNVTGPSHVTILTGLRAIDHGLHHNAGRLPETVETLPQVLLAAGYRTAAFVSSRHLAGDMGWRGFQLVPEVPEQRSAEEVTDLALSWLGQVEAPYFLWVHYWDPHMQYEPPADVAARFYVGDRAAGDGPRLADDPYFERFPRKGVIEWLGDTRDPEWPRAMYAGELHATDREVGRLLAAVEARGDSPLVVVTADHGESLGEHGILYGHRGLYEPQLRVPLIVHLPGAPARRSAVPVSTLDVAPTVSELVGVPLTDARVAGMSLAELVRGEAEPDLSDRVQVHENARNQGVAVRRGEWKLILGIQRGHPLFTGPPELYHLGDDPEETNDVAAAHPALVAELRALAGPWIELGVVERGTSPELDAAARERLRALGYLEDGSDGS
jgi:arylsulfatase